MDREYYDELAKVRLIRANELLEEAVGLLERDSCNGKEYQGAFGNRADRGDNA